MVERLKKDLNRIGLPEETINNPSADYIFSELVELYNRFDDSEVTLKQFDLSANIEFENEDELEIVHVEYDRKNSRLHLRISDKSITIITNIENGEIIKSTAEKVDDIETIESSIYSLSNGLEKKYSRESSGYKDGETFNSETYLVRTDNGYIGKISKVDSPNGEGLGGYVNIDLSSPLILDSNHERFNDVSLISGETVRDGISVPADSTISEEARQLITNNLASSEDEEYWKNHYKAGLDYNTYSVDNSRGL